MQAQGVILLQSDAGSAKSLVSALGSSFPSIHQVGSVGEVRASIAKHRATLAILDMESATLSDVAGLSREFPAASIVCIHRCADEEMWTAALNAGARDLCASADTRGILQAALKTVSATRSAAA
jgi:DNA-binding NarL/FixJ family response regulator